MGTKSNPPKPPSSISNPSLAAVKLSGTLTGKSAEAVVSKAREDLEAHLSKASTPPGAATSTGTIPSMEVPVALRNLPQEEPRDSKTDLAGAEVKQAASQFLTGVDTITDVLLLVLGRLGSAISRVNALIAIGVLLGVGLGYAIFQIRDVAKRHAQTEADFASMVQSNEKLNTRLTEALAKIEQISAKTQEVGKKVDEVKEDQSGIKLVQDDNGHTKLVFQPRIPSRVIDDPSVPLDADDSTPPIPSSASPTPSASQSLMSKAKSAPRKSLAVEIPLSDMVLRQAVVKEAPAAPSSHE